MTNQNLRPLHPSQAERAESRVTEPSERFDPSRYLTKLPKRGRLPDGSWKTTETDYLEVKWRLLWLRTEHPEAAIETEMLAHHDDMAIFRARVSIPGGGSATGWGHETASDFGDYLEKGETKALGRALAALGYGTQFCEDFDFQSSAGDTRVVDTPVERRVGQPARPAASTSQPTPAQQDRPVLLATEPQVKAIYAIARGAQALDDTELDTRCRERYGCVPHELTRRQASEFIDALKLGAVSSAPTPVNAAAPDACAECGVVLRDETPGGYGGNGRPYCSDHLPSPSAAMPVSAAIPVAAAPRRTFGSAPEVIRAAHAELGLLPSQLDTILGKAWRTQAGERYADHWQTLREAQAAAGKTT